MKKTSFLAILALTFVACDGKDSTAGTTNNDTKYKTLDATSVRVIDGDTVEVTLTNQPSERIRLAGIDTPERNQAWGANSTQALKNCIKNKNVQIKWFKKDRYDRLVGYVLASGQSCNYELIKNGHAWHYKKYQNEQPQAERAIYAEAEVEARKQRIGIWSQDCIIAPWDWRKGIKTC